MHNRIRKIGVVLIVLAALSFLVALTPGMPIVALPLVGGIFLIIGGFLFYKRGSSTSEGATGHSTFTNRIYYRALLIVLIINLIVAAGSLFFLKELASVLTIIIQVAMLGIIFKKVENLRFYIKVWSGLMILSGSFFW